MRPLRLTLAIAAAIAAVPVPAEAGEACRILDRIEETVAVIVEGDAVRTVPRGELPPGAREGDLLGPDGAVDREATLRAKRRVAWKRRRLLACDDDGGATAAR